MNKLILLLAVTGFSSLAAAGQNLSTAGTITAQTASCGGNQSGYVLYQLPANSFSTAYSVGITLAGTWTGTTQFSGSVDGNTFTSVPATPQPSGTAVTSSTSNGTWSIPATGLAYVCAYASSYSSGAIAVSMTATKGGGGGSANAAMPGTCVPPQVVQSTTTSGVTCVTPTGSGTVNSGSAYAPAYYPSTGATIAAPNPFTGLGYFSTSGAPAAATPSQVQAAGRDTTQNAQIAYQYANGGDTGLGTPTAGVPVQDKVSAGILYRSYGGGAWAAIIDSITGTGFTITGHTANSNATSANTPSTLVSRDTAGGFVAGATDMQPGSASIFIPNGNTRAGHRVGGTPCSTVWSGSYPTCVENYSACPNTADGYNNGNNSGNSNSATNWWLSNCIYVDVFAYAQGISSAYGYQHNAFHLGDTLGLSGYIHAHGGKERPDDEGVVGHENQIVQNPVTIGTITSGAATGSALLQSNVTSGNTPLNGGALTYDAGGWLLDMSQMITSATITGFGFDSTLNSMYYTVSTTPTQSTAWGVFVPSSCTNNYTIGTAFVTSACSVTLGSGSGSFANSSGATNHIFASGPFREEMTTTASAASSGSQTLTFSTNAAWNGTNAAVVMQGGLAGASFVDAAVVGSGAVPSYPIVGVIGQKVYFANCNSVGGCNGRNSNYGDILPVGKTINIYPSAKILSTSGVAGQAVLDANSAPWANGDSIMSASAANFAALGLRVNIIKNSPNPSCTDVTANCSEAGGIDVGSAGSAGLDYLYGGGNNGTTYAGAVKTMFFPHGGFLNLFRTGQLPGDAFARFGCTQLTGGPADMGWLALNFNTGYSMLKELCATGELNYSHRISANSLYSFNDVTGATGAFSGAVTGTTFNGVGLTTGGVATKYLDQTGSYSTPSYAPLTNPAGGQNNYAPILNPTFSGKITSSSAAVASILAGGATTSASDALAVFRGATNSLHTLELQATGLWNGGATNRTAFIMSTSSASPLYEFGTDVSINNGKDYYIYSYQNGGWVPFYISGTTGCVGIGTNACTAMLDVAGSIKGTVHEVTENAAVASATTIAPTTALFHLTGTTSVSTMTPLAGMATSTGTGLIGGCVTIIADAATPIAAGTSYGNFKAAATLSAGVMYQACLTPSTGLWYLK